MFFNDLEVERAKVNVVDEILYADHGIDLVRVQMQPDGVMIWFREDLDSEQSDIVKALWKAHVKDK